MTPQITYLTRTGTTEDANLDRAIDTLIIPRVVKALGIQPNRQATPQAAPPAKPAIALAAKPKPTEAQLRAAEGAEFVRLFGEKDGAAWFAAGHSMDDAVRLFGQKQIAAAEALKSDAKRATEGVDTYFAAKLSRPPAETKPVAEHKPIADLGNPLPAGLARFAAGITFAKPTPAELPE